MTSSEEEFKALHARIRLALIPEEGQIPSPAEALLRFRHPQPRPAFQPLAWAPIWAGAAAAAFLVLSLGASSSPTLVFAPSPQRVPELPAPVLAFKTESPGEKSSRKNPAPAWIPASLAAAPVDARKPVEAVPAGPIASAGLSAPSLNSPSAPSRFAAAAPENRSGPSSEHPQPDKGRAWIETLSGRWPLNPDQGDKVRACLRLDATTRVRAEVFNLMHEKVAVLGEGQSGPGFRCWTWDGRNSAGLAVAPGTYIIVLAPEGQDARVLKLEVVR